MRSRWMWALTGVAIAGLLGCSTVNVTTDYDRETDFSRYRTFEIAPGASFKNRLQRERFESAATTQLTAKGLRTAAGRPDLLVVMHVRLDRETQIDTTRLGYGYGRWGYWHRGATVRTVRQVPVGTLVVDVVDAARQELVWQAVATDTLDRNASPEERDREVGTLMAKVFASFPPGR